MKTHGRVDHLKRLFGEGWRCVAGLFNRAQKRPSAMDIGARKAQPITTNPATQGSSMKDYAAIDIANYFLARTNADVGDIISNLKLQKLCYYAQGVAVAARGRPLFPEKLEAWLHGPVVPALYQRFKMYENSAIPPMEGLDLSIYEPADRAILDDVYDDYGQYSAWRLREMTHEEGPWRSAYREGASREIDIAVMAEYFATQINDDYRRRHAELRQR